ncbi:MAG: PD-(D/E)XK nuclease family protein [Chloroflexota bacterium]
MNDQGFMPERLSHSMIETYRRCGLEFKRRYVDRVRRHGNPAMSFGRAFHAALEAAHTPGQSPAAVWLRAFQAELPRPEPGVEHGLIQLQRYRERGYLRGAPERGFRVMLRNPEWIPIPIVGVIDLLGDREVGEFKTSRGAWSQHKADQERQAVLYSYAAGHLRGQPGELYPVRYLVFSTAHKGPPDEFVTEPDSKRLEVFEVLAATALDGMRAGKFEPCESALCEGCVEAGAAEIREPRTQSRPQARLILDGKE